MFKEYVEGNEKAKWDEYVSKYGGSFIEGALEHAMIRWEARREDFPDGSFEKMECEIRRDILRDMHEGVKKA